jgi:hypothetical protein
MKHGMVGGREGRLDQPSCLFSHQNVDDAMTVLPKLATGLDVNVRFTGVSDFEYTPECSIFDLLGIPLYHGWLVDPQVRTAGPGESWPSWHE